MANNNEGVTSHSLPIYESMLTMERAKQSITYEFLNISQKYKPHCPHESLVQTAGRFDNMNNIAGRNLPLQNL